MKEYRTRDDKESWGNGPWIEEPDKVQWVDEATGLDCLAVRAGRAGHWCGYVGVSPEHPLHGIDYSQEAPVFAESEDEWDRRPESRLQAHGGITFADSCSEPTREQWESIPGRLSDPEMIASAKKYPDGDYAHALAELRKQADLDFDEWVEYQQARRICHVPEDGRPANVWWFGFDCAHLGDLSPGYAGIMPSFGRDDVYRRLEYVKLECADLARQLAELMPAVA